MLLRLILYTCMLACSSSVAFAQSALPDSIVTSKDVKKAKMQVNGMGSDTSASNTTFVYKKPRPFDFLTRLPKDAAGIATAPFHRKAIKPLIYITASTILLMMADESINRGLHNFSADIHWHTEEDYRDVITLKGGKSGISLLKFPKNLNTAFYQIGQGFPSLMIGAGLFVYGKIHHNVRAISTASQLAESFILMGAGTQILKRITGRQSPSEVPVELDATWHFFPSFSQFQSHTPNYDAFPSGHLATLMSTVTVLCENYPEKKWIKPVGYGITGMVGLAMINNNVHWASDYPLAIALGYLCAKQVAKSSRHLVKKNDVVFKKKTSLSYTCHYIGGKLQPGLLYKF